MVSALRIFLFGKFDVQYGEQVLTGLDARKVQELFCYLLIFRKSPHLRESLAALLWGGNSTARSRKYLRQALWQLQSAIEPSVLLLDPEWVQFNREADIWLDVELFEQAFTKVQGVPGQELTLQGAQALKDAVQLYRGDLLYGCHQDWCLFERERLQTMYLAMLDKLLGHCEAQGEYEIGMIYGACILRYDRARERTHRRLMRLHYLAGNRTAALREYEACVAALDEELGVGPAKSTVALYEQIRADQLGGPTRAPAEGTADALDRVLHRLERLQTALVDMQQQIQRDIQAVERVRNGQGQPPSNNRPR